jgi:microcystin-dependent protein
MPDPFIGEIRMFTGDYAPRGWKLCDGSQFPISEYQALYSVIGVQYGGDGRTSFALPDLRGRIPLCKGQGPGTSYYQMGRGGGQEYPKLDVSQMPQHMHEITHTLECAPLAANKTADQMIPAENLAVAKLGSGSRTTPLYADPTSNPQPLAPSAVTGTIECQDTGGANPMDVRQPYMVINFIIAIEGEYPSRN